LVRMRESDFASFIWNDFMQLIGKNNLQYLEQMQTDPVLNSMVLGWVSDDGLFYVEVWDGANWVVQDAFGAGNEVFTEVIVPVEVPEGADTVKVRLRSATSMFVVDSALMDFSEQEDYEVQVLSASSAVQERDGAEWGVLEDLLLDDALHVTEQTGDVIHLEFDTVPEEQGAERSYIVSVKGYFINNIKYKRDLKESLPEMQRMYSERGYAIEKYLPIYLGLPPSE